jgi:hypothetical protein
VRDDNAPPNPSATALPASPLSLNSSTPAATPSTAAIPAPITSPAPGINLAAAPAALSPALLAPAIFGKTAFEAETASLPILVPTWAVCFAS